MSLCTCLFLIQRFELLLYPWHVNCVQHCHLMASHWTSCYAFYNTWSLGVILCSVKLVKVHQTVSFLSCDRWCSMYFVWCNAFSVLEFARWKCYSLRKFIICDWFLQSVWTATSIELEDPRPRKMAVLSYVAIHLCMCSPVCIQNGDTREN